jgi:hypothetical protein
MARISKPTKPRVTDSIEKWNVYRAKEMAWQAALAKNAREKEAKTLMSKGEFSAADKILKAKTAKKGAKKR